MTTSAKDFSDYLEKINGVKNKWGQTRLILTFMLE